MGREKLEALDASLDRISLSKRLQIEAEHLKRIKCNRTLRVYVDPAPDSIRIFTRVLGDFKAEEGAKLWNIVQRVVVAANTTLPTIDEELGDDGTENNTERLEDGDAELFEWTGDADAFVVTRQATHRSYQILIKLRNQRQILKLNKHVRRLFDKYSDTRQNIIKDFYRYINTNKLNDYATSTVKCDEVLQGIFHVDSFSFNDIGRMIDPLVEPVGYCVINAGLDAPQIWDIGLECDDLSQMPVLYPKNVQEMEKKIEANKIVCQKITEKIGVLEEFIEDPIFFINRKIALESDGLGVQTGFYDDLSVQTAVFELIKRHE